MTEDHIQHPRAWVATILLALASVIAFADKTLPTLLMDPIKHAMALSDTEIGMLTGFSFAIAMALAALPLAWLADRYDRAWLLTAAIVIWCTMTIASGFAHDFTTLFITRLGVGIGEAALMPAALSLIGDLFPLKRIARAAAVLAYAATVGGFVAMTGGGALYEHFLAAANAGSLPLASADAWRWTTISFGAAGLVVALLVALVLPEPRRKKASPAATSAAPAGTGFVDYLRQSQSFLLILILCLSLSMIFVGGFNGWLAPFFARTYSWSIGEVGRVLGTTMLIAGLAAPVIGIFFSQLMRRLLGREAPLAAICAMLAVALPFVVGGPLLANGFWAAIAVGVSMAITGGCGIVISVIYVSIAPSYLRARITATLFLVFGIIGSVGPVAYASFTDKVLMNPARLYLSLSLVSGVLIVLAIIAGILADRLYPAAVERAREADKVHGADYTNV